MQVAFDVVMAAGDAGIWQRIVRPALQRTAVEAPSLLCSGANSLSPADARRLRGVLGPLPKRAAAQLAPQAAGAGAVTHALCISGVYCTRVNHPVMKACGPHKTLMLLMLLLTYVAAHRLRVKASGS